MRLVLRERISLTTTGPPKAVSWSFPGVAWTTVSTVAPSPGPATAALGFRPGPSAAADVPVRIPRAVVAVPVEGAIVDTVVHVTPGNDQPLVSLHPTILFISCSHFRRHPSSMIFFHFAFPLPEGFMGEGIPHVPLEMVIFDQEGGRRCARPRTQSRCNSPGRKARQSYRRARYHQR